MVAETYVLSGSWSRIASLGGRDPVNVTGDARIHTSIIWRSTTIAPARDSHLNSVNKKRSATVTLARVFTRGGSAQHISANEQRASILLGTDRVV